MSNHDRDEQLRKRRHFKRSVERSANAYAIVVGGVVICLLLYAGARRVLRWKAQVGANCTTDADCWSGACRLREHGQTALDGYCTDTCAADTDCPQHLRCAGVEPRRQCVSRASQGFGDTCRESFECESSRCETPPALDGASTGAAVCVSRGQPGRP